MLRAREELHSLVFTFGGRLTQVQASVGPRRRHRQAFCFIESKDVLQFSGAILGYHSTW